MNQTVMTNVMTRFSPKRSDCAPATAHCSILAYRYPIPAFTLVEMVVVIAILAILITAVVAVTGSIRDRAKTQLTEVAFQQIELGLDQYEKDWKTYPKAGNYTNIVEVPAGEKAEDPYTNATNDPFNLTSNGPYYWLQSNECLSFALAERYLESMPSQLLVIVDENPGGTADGMPDEYSNPDGVRRLRLVDGWKNPIFYFSVDPEDYDGDSRFVSSDEFDNDPDGGSLLSRFGKVGGSETNGAIPLLTSFGKDGKFNTADDIRSEESN